MCENYECTQNTNIMVGNAFNTQVEAVLRPSTSLGYQVREWGKFVKAFKMLENY